MPKPINTARSKKTSSLITLTCGVIGLAVLIFLVSTHQSPSDSPVNTNQQDSLTQPINATENLLHPNSSSTPSRRRQEMAEILSQKEDTLDQK